MSLKSNCFLSHQCRKPGCNLRHTLISITRLCESEVPAIKYLVRQRTLSTLAEKSKLLNKYQILLRVFDENSWKLDVNIRLLGHLQSQTKIVRTLLTKCCFFSFSCFPPSLSKLFFFLQFGHQILYTNIEGTRRPQSVTTILTETVVLCKHLLAAVLKPSHIPLCFNPL